MMRGRPGLIARWKAGVDCRDIVQSYGVQLDHNGVGRCPFHDDAHASFQAWADGWRCYAENRGGDALPEPIREAVEACRQTINIDPKHYQAYWAAGNLYVTNRQYEEAATAYERSLSINPNFADAHLLAGNIWLRAGRRAEAAPEFEEYLRLSPDGQFAAQARDSVQKIKAALAKKP